MGRRHRIHGGNTVSIASPNADAFDDDLTGAADPAGVDPETLAQSLVCRLRAVEAAVREHAAAVQAETTRRAELVLAQAELDAELIRLYARRDSHALLAGARPDADPGEDAADAVVGLDALSRSALRAADALDEHLRGLAGLRGVRG